jgi:hypothetical protein
MGISDRFARRTDSAPRTGARGAGRGRLLGGGIAVAAAGALAATALAGAGPALAAGRSAAGVTPAVAATPPAAGGYQFVEIGSHRDRTFNQLLGINNNGRIAGYYGSGAKGHPNKGYLVSAPYAQGDIKGENFPHSVQTQVTGLNNNGVQVGFYSTQNNASGVNNNFGWYFNGSFHEVAFPTGNNDKPTTDQLLGVNDHDVAVGFYLNGSGTSRGYTYNIKTRHYALVTEPGAPTGGKAPWLSANAINNAGDVAGAYVAAGGVTDGFLKLAGGAFHKIAISGASSTVALGVNNNDTVVGFYTDGSGSTETTHGFIWRIGGGVTTKVDDQNGIGSTTLNGINDEGDIVGFYVDSKGNTDGLLAFPAF